jgi:hypothetical protein
MTPDDPPCQPFVLGPCTGHGGFEHVCVSLDASSVGFGASGDVHEGITHVTREFAGDAVQFQKGTGMDGLAICSRHTHSATPSTRPETHA